MAKPITIGQYDFKTKKAAKDYIRDLRDRYPVDGVEITGCDELFLHDILALHPEASDKIGSGINNFTVETDPEFRRTRHFMIHRADGSCTDFSFNACIDGRNDRADRLESLRRAVEDQIVSFRDDAFSGSTQVICPIDGSTLTPNTCHVDHVSPSTFIVLAERWLASEGITIFDVCITPPADNQVVANMIDADQIISWETFHRSEATLRVVSPRSNLTTPKNQTG